MLSVRDLHAGYGSKMVLRGISLDVPRGVIVTVLGANGAGKSTLLRAIVGLLPRSIGTVTLDDKSLPDSAPDRTLKAGVALVPEQRELFLSLSVADNLRLGGYLRRGSADLVAESERLLDIFPSLRARLAQPARTLSGGEQQMLAIARALMGRPEFLLLDEPSLGLAPVLSMRFSESFARSVRKERRSCWSNRTPRSRSMSHRQVVYSTSARLRCVEQVRNYEVHR